MSGLEVVGDMAGMWHDSTATVVSGLAGLGAGEWLDSVQFMVDAMDVLAGSMSIAASLAGIKEGIEAANTAKAAAEATAHLAAGPIGWGKVAMALAAMGTTAAVVGAITTYTIRADLSNPSEATATAQMIGAIA